MREPTATPSDNQPRRIFGDSKTITIMILTTSPRQNPKNPARSASIASKPHPATHPIDISNMGLTTRRTLFSLRDIPTLPMLSRLMHANPLQFTQVHGNQGPYLLSYIAHKCSEQTRRSGSYMRSICQLHYYVYQPSNPDYLERLLPRVDQGILWQYLVHKLSSFYLTIRNVALHFSVRLQIPWQLSRLRACGQIEPQNIFSTSMDSRYTTQSLDRP